MSSKMVLRMYITKSKSGHYTLSVYKNGFRIHQSWKLGSKQEARYEFQEYLKAKAIGTN